MKVKVDHVKIEPCGAANDGFLSILHRAYVDYHINTESYHESFVVKSASNNEIALDVIGIKGFDVQNREMMFYSKIAPQMEAVLTKIGDSEHVFPKIVFVDQEHDVIIFEDLKKLNFVMADRLTGLDKAHLKLGLQKLAKFQAASLIVLKQHPKMYESFNIGMFNRTVTTLNMIYVKLFEIAAEEIETWPGYENYAEKMRKSNETFVENATRCFDVASGDFCVLNHGDIWTNNFMFRYGDEGKVDDAIMVLTQSLSIFR